MDERDCLDVALFQYCRVGQPRALRFLLAQGSSAALSHGIDGRKLIVTRIGR